MASTDPNETTISQPRPRGAARERVGHFRLIRLLGSGGQGEVWEAHDERLQRRVALKLLSRRVDTLAPGTRALVRARFEREAEVAARIDHPGICAVHEFGEDEGLPWIAMRLVEGESLRARIRRRRDQGLEEDGVNPFDSTTIALPGAERASASSPPDLGEEPRSTLRTTPGPGRDEIAFIVAFAASAARALHAAHEAGLVHRDVKPGNLMVTEEGRAVVLDFGLAADDHTSGPALTMTGDFIGTPAYMAPEQIAGQRHVDRRCDVHALGATLYEALTLCPAFEAATREGLYRKIRLEDPLPPRELNPQISRDLATVILAAMDKDPLRRYQSAAALAEDLRRVLDHEPVLARPAGPLLRLSRWVQRDPVVAAMVAALVLFATIFSGWTTMKNRELGALNAQLATANRRLQDKRLESDAHAATARRAARARGLALAEKSAALDAERAARAREAEARRGLDRALAEYERMADTRRLEEAREQAADLWPVRPELAPRLLAWQEEFAPLFARLPEHRARLEALRAQALPYEEADRRRDFAPEFEEIRRHEELLEKVAEMRARGMTPEEAKTVEKHALEIEAKQARLMRVVRGRRSWRFGDDVEARFRHDVLARLVDALETFIDPRSGTTADIARRLDLARRLSAATIEAPAARWREARIRVAASPHYGGLELEPQMGLVPLGPDPRSGLEEFLHWASHAPAAPPPRRGDDGRFVVEADTGMILVLVPGGHFLMGAQAERPGSPRHDPAATAEESPLAEVELAPFFLSKYEISQAQWLRLTGENPSYYDPGSRAPGMKGRVDLRHPVEQVSWLQAREMARQQGLLLPTEAQWEYAARAATDLRFPGTDAIADLARYANIGGLEFASFLRDHCREHRDEHLIHAPVGSFLPNAWGFHDLCGNVFEWCEDAKGRYGLKPRGPRGLRRSRSVMRVIRGGAFDVRATLARLTQRSGQVETVRAGNLGLRPARALE